MAIKIEDVRVEGHGYYLSLSKIIGKSIKDIYGYISLEFGDPSFKLTRIVFDDDSALGVEGEHDHPYPVLMTRDDPFQFEEKLDALSERDE
jgi:hypothetical protein